jgi:histidinol phosphatase-like enzyme
MRHVLPGRIETIEKLYQQGKQVAYVWNRGDVAYGMATEQEATNELMRVVSHVTSESVSVYPFYTVCFAHPKPDYLAPNRTFDVKYATPEMLYRRMPNPGMLEEAIKFYHVWPHEVDVVGNNWENLYAARAAHVRTFYDSSTYFGEKVLPPPPAQCEKIFNW